MSFVNVMKKIITHGKKQEKVIVCNNCNCEFSSDEYKESKIVGRDYVKISDKCPECKRKIEFTEDL